MTSETLTQILLGAILIVGALISAYGIPYLNALIDRIETTKFYDFVWKAVEWANQTIPPEEWARKKVEVVKLCNDYMLNHLKVKFTQEQINVIIEAIVREAKKIASKVD